MSISGNGKISGSLDSPGLIWTSYNGYYGTDVNYFSTATTRTGANGAYRGTSSDLTNTSTATNGNFQDVFVLTNGGYAPDTFSVQWLGYFLAPQTGTYTWSINSDDYSYLWIGQNAKTGYTTSNYNSYNAIFVDNWDIQNTPASIVLNAGVYYPIRIQYGDSSGPNNFSLYFNLPGSVTAIYNGAGYYFNDGTLLDNVLLNPSTVVARMTFFMESNGLTNYYSFDSGITVANYASGNAVSDITLYGGAVISSSVFKVGSGSLYLNAANSQYAQIASSALTITTNGVSFACWFNFNSSNGYWARLFDFGSGPENSNILYAPFNSVLSVNNNITVFQPTVGYNYTDNNWHHFCWTIAYTSLTTDTNTWKLYIDGVVVYTTAVGNYPNITTRTNNYIGKSNWDDPYATGYVDDFRIYNRVVSSSEVLSLIASQ